MVTGSGQPARDETDRDAALPPLLVRIRARVRRRLVAAARPSQILIRVPLFERHWQVPMRRELGVSYFSDPTHYIEHTLDEFAGEIDAAGLEITERLTLWGEIWAVCRAPG